MRKAGICTAVVAGALLGACNPDITVPNYNNPTTTGVGADPGSLQLLANGVGFTLGSGTGYVDDVGTLGRESFEYTPTEGRNTQHFLQVRTLDPAGFAALAANFSRSYNNIRNTFFLLQAVEAASIPTEQKAAARGFAKTIEALELYYVIATRDTLGAPVEVREELSFIAPFVSRDSVYKYINARLDEAAADLTAAGSSAFPFTLPIRFQGITGNPVNFLKFNRAIAARVYAYRGSIVANDPTPKGQALACGAPSCYDRALTALGASFLNASPAGRADLDIGVYNIYGTGNGETQNSLSRATTTGALRYAHPSIVRDTAAARDANGRSVYATENPVRANDLRVRAKIITLPSPASPGSAIAESAISTPYGFSIYAAANSPIPIIKNEELILLRAEARLYTGDVAGALADVNTIRTVSGGLAPRATLGATTRDQVKAILDERWLSLLYEGHRIIDLRRFNRLDVVPIDKMATSANSVQHYVNSVFPIPQQECLNRQNFRDIVPLPAGCT